MAYVAPKDYSQEESIIEASMRKMAGDLDLDWMDNIRERAAFRPSDVRRGFTVDDMNQGTYGPEHAPELVRHNFSMAPRGALLPKGLPSLGYTLNRKSEVWSDTAGPVFEEGKSRHWAPARDVPWSSLDGIDRNSDYERALRQLSTTLSSVGLGANDIAARWVWHLNIEFHEIKYLLCLQMIDGARLCEAFRKRALYGSGSLGVDSVATGELLKMALDAGSYPRASATLNLLIFSWVQGLGRHLEYRAQNAADAFLGTRLAQDASRFLAYGVDHIRSATKRRGLLAEDIHEHLDLVENGWVGALGAPEVIEPLILLGDVASVAAFYERTIQSYFARCAAAGLGNREERSPLPDFIRLLRD